MFTGQTIAGAAQRIFENTSIPLRMPSHSATPYWGEPLTITRARPLPVGAAWVNFFQVPNKNLMSKVIYKYILTPFNEGQVEFRLLVGGGFLAPDSFALPVAVERHIDRIVANPYPAEYRETFIAAKHDQDVLVQVRNLSQAIQLMFGSFIGWYYPALLNPDEITPQQGMDDEVRHV